MQINATKVDEARELALLAHQGQTDKLGVPYSAHLAHVASQVRRLGAEYEVIGWLHDILEDTPVTLADIEHRFGAVVARGVDSMTRRDGEIYFEHYLPRLIQNPIAVPCKFADCRHNIGKAHLRDDKVAAASLSRRYERVLKTLEAAQPQLARWGDWEDLVFDGRAWVAAADAT